MVDEQRLKNIAASLSFSPLPRDTSDWMHEPSLQLLTDDESDGLVSVLEKLEGSSPESLSFTFELARLRPEELTLLETFIEKSFDGKARMRANGFPSILAMNVASRPTA